MDMTHYPLSPPAHVSGLIISALGSTAGSRRLSLTEIAARMCVSSRTLKRRLHRQGLSYRQLLDDVRLGHAVQLMRQPGLSLEVVAMHIGYSSAANFSRAFTRWAGVTPGRFREQGNMVAITATGT